MSRAKESRFTKEGQKVFRFSKWIPIAIGIFFIVVIVFIAGRRWYLNSKAEPSKSSSERFIPRDNLAHGVNEFVLIPGQEMEKILPYDSYFWINPQGQPVIIRRLDGRKFVQEPDGNIFSLSETGEKKRAADLGEVPGSVLYLSAIQTPTKVILTIRSK